MSSPHTAIHLSTPPASPPPPGTALRHRRTASPAQEDNPSGSDRQRQKRRRIEVDSDVEFVAAGPGLDVDIEPSSQPETHQSPLPRADTALAQISTWEIAPDIAFDIPPYPTDEEPPKASSNPISVLVDEPGATPNAPVSIDLSDSDDPTIVSPRAAQTSSGAPPDDPSSSPSRAPAAVTTATPSLTTPEPLSAYTCPICFSPPTNATLTPCGHICCGQCLFTAIKSTIRRNTVVTMDGAPSPRYVSRPLSH